MNTSFTAGRIRLQLYSTGGGITIFLSHNNGSGEDVGRFDLHDFKELRDLRFCIEQAMIERGEFTGSKG